MTIKCVAAIAVLALLAGCGRNVSHGPAAPTTNVNPQTGSTGSGR